MTPSPSRDEQIEDGILEFRRRQDSFGTPEAPLAWRAHPYVHAFRKKLVVGIVLEYRWCQVSEARRPGSLSNELNYLRTSSDRPTGTGIIVKTPRRRGDRGEILLRMSLRTWSLVRSRC